MICLKNVRFAGFRFKFTRNTSAINCFRHSSLSPPSTIPLNFSPSYLFHIPFLTSSLTDTYTHTYIHELYIAPPKLATETKSQAPSPHTPPPPPSPRVDPRFAKTRNLLKRQEEAGSHSRAGNSIIPH